ncbi:ATP-binding cassette domain-containing protein [Actinomadura madurae]|uniref:ABC transporter permease subunit n=1 Tax=Actinomadura madurae TaxID=1993 RepID=UPI00399A0DBE
MNELLPFIVTGVTSGAVYGLAGSGLVITYRTSGVFNFAHGALAAVAAYVFYWLTTTVGLNWVVAFVLAVPVLGSLMGIALELIGRRISRRSPAMQVSATVGIIVIVTALATIAYGPDPLQMEPYIPGAGSSFRIAGVNIGHDQLIITCVALLATGGLYLFSRFTRSGLAMRAVVDDADLVGTHGTNPVRVRRVAWVLGSVLASASGVLLAPLVGLQVLSLTYLVVAAIGAASIGAFSSIPVTYLGGIVIGIAADISQKYVLTIPWLAGIPLSIPFVTLLVALIVVPRRKLFRRINPDKRPVVRLQAPLGPSLVTAVVVIAVLLLIPTFAGAKLTNYMLLIPMAIMLLSLGLLVRTAGQVSLCQAAFGAIGAFSFSQIIMNFGLPWLLALVLGGLVVVPVAALVALPAVRLSGIFFALATLGFGIMMERLIYPLNFAFGSDGAGRPMPRPSWASSDEAFYFLLVALFVVAAAILTWLDRGRLGRMLRGLSESPTALRTMGLTLGSTRILVFAVSGFFAGVAGILYGSTVGFAAYSDGNYASFQSLVLLAILIISPFGVPWYGLFAAPVVIIPAYISGESVPNWLNVVFGVFAVVVALQNGAPGAPRWVRDLFQRLSRQPRRTVRDEALPLPRPLTRQRDQAAPGLEVQNLHVHFGGVKAVDGVDLQAPIGRVTGLIGPNGAGKTTTFNACSGLVRPSAGHVLLHGKDVNRMSASARAREGLGRTFQVTELCESLTVRQNVGMGVEATQAGWNPISQLGLNATRAQRQHLADTTDRALQLCGIEHLADSLAGTLSTGERRLVEVSRCLAGDFDILLLDEPSAGLDHEESARLREVLAAIMTERRCGILLVEHDMAFVMKLCDYIYVLDFGKPLFEGSPREVASSPEVQAAYLGTSLESQVS